jgi:peptide/nickel transport system permease protein
MVDSADILDSTRRGGRSTPRRRWWRFRSDWGTLVGLTVISGMLLCAMFAPLIAPYSPTDQALREKAQGPSLRHPLGLDELGRDLLSRVLYGARDTLGGALAAVVLSAIAGVILGLTVGYVGGPVDEIVMRIADGMLAFPYIVVAVFLAALLGPGLWGAIIAVAIASVPGYTRLIRSIVLTVREQEYVRAAVGCGATSMRVATRHVLPNSISPLIVFASLDAAGVLIRLSSLSFIGMGAQPPTPDWGLMLTTAQEWLGEAPHIAMVPGVAIVLAAVALNLVGEGLRDVFDPRLGTSR